MRPVAGQPQAASIRRFVSESRCFLRHALYSAELASCREISAAMVTRRCAADSLEADSDLDDECPRVVAHATRECRRLRKLGLGVGAAQIPGSLHRWYYSSEVLSSRHGCVIWGLPSARVGACLMSWMTRGRWPGTGMPRERSRSRDVHAGRRGILQCEGEAARQGLRSGAAVAGGAEELLAVGGMRADEAAALVLRARWQRLSCADGSNGPRLYDWALIGTAEGPGHHLLVRRSLVRGEEGQLEPVFFRSWSRRPVTLPEVAAVARARWGVEDCFAEAKGEAGLDRYRSASTGPGTGTSPWPCSRTRSLPPPPAPPGPPSARPPSLKGGPDTCGQRFASPRTYAPPAFV